MRMGWLVAPVIGVAACVGALAWSAQDDNSRSDTYKELELFADVLVRVQNEYVSPIEDKKAIQAAIQGMLTSLDPHSSYLAPEDFKDMQVQTRGEYGGLGIEVTAEDGIVKVVSPIDDTPAAKAGVQAGDYLTAIDGQSIIGFDLSDAVNRMRGPVGTSIQLTIARENSEPFDVNLTREIIAVKSVNWKLDKDIGILRVSAFNEKTGDALEEGIRAMRKQAGSGLRGVVLDLRNNPGGLLDQAVQVSDAFLDGGEVVSTRGRRADQIERYNAKRGDMLAGIPMAVLINQGSASASEIVAGALQDRGRALLLGTTSFGKGSVQTVIPLKGGRDGALRLTTAKYYTPAGRSIQGSGIDPDIEVSDKKVDVSKLKRLGLSESDLKGAFANPDGAKRKGPHIPDDQPPENWDKTQDYQLKRAEDYLHQGVVAERLRAKAG
ncbi:MAG TPA: S41 family peptidase [Caulobacterales bacterium]|jgi:carboxyl-terminal processing protease|nr:S41 family peptidase [Caulobacterales bacterium]